MAEISSRALMNALYAIRSEITNNERLLAADETNAEERDSAADYTFELNAAFGEFAAYYKERQAINKNLLPFDTLFD